MSIDFGLVAGGLLGGFLVGLTGMGGGALLTPMLVFFFHVDAAAAVGSDLVASLVMKPIGGAVHWRSRTVRTDIVRWLCLGSVPGAFIGVGLLQVLPEGDTEDVVKVLLGGALLLTAVTMLVRDRLQARRERRLREAPSAEPTVARAVPTLLLGLFGGAIVGLTSVGSGSLMIVVLSFLYPRLPRHELVGTDLVQAIPLVMSAAISHVLVTGMDWSILLPLIIGGSPGTFLGARLAAHISQSILRRGIAIVLTLTGLGLLKVPPVWVGIIGAAMLILGPVAWGLIKHAHGRRAFLHVPLGRRQGLQHHETVGAPPTDPGS